MHSIDLILTLTGAFGVSVLCGLETLGATPEQIERERARVHGELR